LARSDKWNPSSKDLELLEKLAGFGLSNEKMADIFNISRSTFQRELVNNEELRDTLDRGKAKVSVNVIGKAYELCMKGNVTMLIFWLRCREGWKDEFPDIKGEIPIKINYVRSGDDDQATAAPVDVPKS
jgi:hypothetical protein